MRRLCAFSCCVFLSWLQAAPLRAQVFEHRDVGFDYALHVAQGALAECRSHGWAVTVVVVGRDGEMLVSLSDDKAPPHTRDTAVRKAFTARSWSMPTSEFLQNTEKLPAWKQAAMLPGMTGIPGGVPIVAEGETIGGVGISGSPGKDEDCANAGLAAAK